MTKCPPVILREGKITYAIHWLCVAWILNFTFDVLARADDVTSRQWQYLMSVPGHKFFWASLFGISAILIIFGLLSEEYKYTLRCIGLLIGGSGCLMVVAFYILAPLIDPGLTTLGFHPWMVPGVIFIAGAFINWKPVKWS